MPGRPGCSNNVGDSFVSFYGTESTKSEAGRFLDLGDKSFELFVKAYSGHGAISELGPPPKPGSGLFRTDPGGTSKTSAALGAPVMDITSRQDGPAYDSLLRTMCVADFSLGRAP